MKPERLSELDTCDESSGEPGESCCRIGVRNRLGGFVVEYGPTSTSPITPHSGSISAADVSERLQAFGVLDARVTVHATDVDIQICVEHGTIVQGAANPSLGRCDVIMLQKTDGRLLISANCALARESYRQVLGELFGNSPQHFRRLYRYVSRPLVELGARALASHGIGTVKCAVLRQLRFEMVGTMESIEWKGNDLGRQLDSHLGQLLRRHREIRAFRLDLETNTPAQVVTVDVRVPHLIRYSHPAARTVVSEYLDVAGFLLREPEIEGAP